MDKIKKFLEAYKELEMVCKKNKKEVKDMEIVMGINRHDPEANKLKMCRQIRNFITHNAYEGFIEITDGMIKYVKGITKAIKNGKYKKKYN